MGANFIPPNAILSDRKPPISGFGVLSCHVIGSLCDTALI